MQGDDMVTTSGPSGGAACTAALRPPWRVARTQRHREAVAHTQLAQRGFDTYLPLLRQWPPPAVGSEVGPLFPGYVFVRADAPGFHRIARTPGLLGLVVFGDEPPELDADVIEFLQAREGPDGVIQPNPPAHGRAVRITHGPFRGLEAVLEQRLTGRQRVLILLDLLQRKTRVELPESWVRLA